MHHRMVIPDVVAVAVAVNTYERLERGNLLRHDSGAEVAGVPHDIDRFEKIPYFIVEITVCI